jgi:hypothetical protein
MAIYLPVSVRLDQIDGRIPTGEQEQAPYMYTDYLGGGGGLDSLVNIQSGASN